MPFGVRIRRFGFLLEVVTGVSDEIFENIWVNSTNPNTPASEKKGSIASESSKHVNKTYSIIPNTGKCN